MPTDPTTSAIPSPPTHGLLGHQQEYAADPLGSFRRWTAAMGVAVRLRFGPVQVLLLTSPEAVLDVLVRQEAAFRKAPAIRQLASRVIGNALFNAEGAAWREQRALLEEFFSKARVEAHVPIIAREFAASVDRWSGLEVVEALTETMRVSQSIAGWVLFGIEVSDRDIDIVARALVVTAADFQHGIDQPLSLLLPAWLPTSGQRRRRRAVTELDGVVQRMLADRLNRGGGGPDLLGDLLRRRKDMPWLTERLIRDNVLSLLTESREDPGLLLTWALYLLGRHPEDQERVAAEIERELGGRLPQVNDLGRLELTARVLREALRLYPPVYGTGRQAVMDCTVAGITVKRGTVVLLSQDVMNHQAHWFPDPDAFRPARWLDRPERTLADGVFTPFNIGPRRCLGERLAWTIGLVGLAVMVGRLRFTPADSRPVEPTVMLSLRPSREVRLQVRPR